jgi:hypothetical protein
MTKGAGLAALDFADLEPDERRAALSNATLIGDTWPNPLPLPIGLPPVPELDPAILPDQLREYVEDIAGRFSVPLDYVGAAAMVAIGSVIGRRIGIRPQTQTDWTEVCNLWGCIVGSPGALKSPVVREVLAPLRLLEQQAAEAHSEDMKAYKISEQLCKIETEVATGAVRKTLSAKNVKPGELDAARARLEGIKQPTPPVAVRLLTSDATVEKLGEICKDNPDGLLVHRDELLSMFSDLDREEKATARGFFLTGWSGQERYTFDRIIRGTVAVEAVNISVFGTTQPTRLTKYVQESLRLRDDGMVQRLQILVWPDISKDWVEADRHPNSQAKKTAFECFTRLHAINAAEVGAEVDPYAGSGAVPFLRFDPEAQQLFSKYRAELEVKIRDEDMPPEISAHLSKFRGLIPRISLICHLANGGSGPVSVQAIKMALGWSDYLEGHMRRVYASVGGDTADVARKILRRIKMGQLAQGFSARELKRHHWGGLTGERVDQSLEMLVEYDWLRVQATETGGRPSITFQINPKAFEQNG